LKTILTDIEGTTSSISFVRDVLFPYSRAALPGFVAEHGSNPDVRRWLDQVAAEHGGICDDRMLAEVLQGWIDTDRKHTALKALQGMIWKAGYDDGAYRSHMYPDAPLQLRAWHAAGHPLYIYSSGSVSAQKLLFAHSEAGDLAPLFSGHFDTEIGGKRDAGSYRRITAAIDCAPQNLLFLSDVVEELDAAREAGLGTVLIDRREDYPQPRLGDATNGHHRVTSFAAIVPEH